jgi:hypothetical protein
MHPPVARRAVNILPGLEVRRKPVLNFLDCILESNVYFIPFLGIVHSEVILCGYIPRPLHGRIADFLQNFSCEGMEADLTISRLLGSVLGLILSC